MAQSLISRVSRLKSGRAYEFSWHHWDVNWVFVAPEATVFLGIGPPGQEEFSITSVQSLSGVQLFATP